MLARAIVVVACTGCGRFGFGESVASDAATDAGDAASAPDASGWTSFSAPVRLAGPVNSATDDWAPSVVLAGTEIYFHSFRGTSGTADIWHATRPSPADALGVPTIVSELSTTTYDEAGPTLTQDGLVIVFQSKQSGNADLYISTRPDTNSLFGAPVALTALNTAGYDSYPWLSSDGLRLLWGSSITGSQKIYESSRASRADAFSAPTPRHELDSAGADYGATLSSDGLEIIFASDRAGGAGKLDLYTARRAALDQPFGAITRLPELSSANDDVHPRLSPDGTTLYFNYDTDVGGGLNADFWSATRMPL